MTVARRETLTARVLASFQTAFGGAPEFFVAAPGRVNLIGEHTDYNDGFVLPCAIDYETLVAIAPTDQDDINIVAADYDDDADSIAIDAPFVGQSAEWKNHVRGVVASFSARGHKLGGANVTVAGNVPRGAGLSSSASLGVALGKALVQRNGLDQLSATDIALIAQQAENDFVGTACGIMDQLVSARSLPDHAMLLDCRSLTSRPITIPDDICLLIIHSGIARGLVDSAYNLRRKQCNQAAAHYGVAALRDLDMQDLIDQKQRLDPIDFRRARHVVSENKRCLQAADALERHDIVTLSKLMAASHASMRDDFEITLPAIDQLVEIVAAQLGDQGGARMTGGGFGGCVVALLKRDRRDAIVAAVTTQYRDPDGNVPTIFECRMSAGVSSWPANIA